MVESLILESLLKKAENSRLAFIAEADVESICKIATSLVNGDGGDILIGVDANKKIAGIVGAERIIGELTNNLHSEIVPAIPFSITPFQYREKQIVLVSIWAGANKPYSFKGKIYVRSENNTVPATGPLMDQLIEDSKNAFFHWERQPILGFELEDLDQEELHKTIHHYNSQKDRQPLINDVEEFLTYLGLYNNGNLSNAAVLLFGKTPVRYLPQAKIRVTAFQGKKSENEILYDRFFEGNIFKNIDAIWEFLVITFGQKNQISGIQRTARGNFPTIAVREGLMNAIVHRDYASLNTTLNLLLYPDRFQILNTGRLPDGISIEDLREEHFSILRNPDIAQVCYIRGYIEMLGSGTLRMISNCKDEGFAEPVWKEASNATILTFPGLGAISTKGEGVNEGVNEGVDIIKIEGVNEGVKRELLKIIEFLEISPGIRTNEIAEHLNKGISTVQRYIKILKKREIIRFNGPPKTGGYYLIKN